MDRATMQIVYEAIDNLNTAVSDDPICLLLVLKKHLEDLEAVYLAQMAKEYEVAAEAEQEFIADQGFIGNDIIEPSKK